MTTRPTNGLEELVRDLTRVHPRPKSEVRQMLGTFLKSYIPKQQLREALVDENVKHGEFAPAIASEGDKLTRNKLRAELRKKFGLDE